VKKTKKVGTTPDWFVLEKYQECSSFKAIDWLANLLQRQSVFEHLARSEMDSASQLTKEIRNDPSGSYFLCDTPDSPVQPLTFDKIVMAAFFAKLGDIIPSMKETAEKWAQFRNAISTNALIDPMTNSNSFSPIDLNRSNELPIIVDLSINDSMLIEAFSVWLKDVRAQKGISASRERPAYKNWARYGLLPYLDLLIWSQENNYQIPHNIMREKIGYRLDNDAFRKTVPPLAKSLMDDLTELKALAAIEAASEKHQL